LISQNRGGVGGLPWVGADSGANIFVCCPSIAQNQWESPKLFGGRSAGAWLFSLVECVPVVFSAFFTTAYPLSIPGQGQARRDLALISQTRPQWRQNICT
jgi:hypothetical protein